MTNWYGNVPAPTDANGELVPLNTRELLFDGERRSVMCYLYGPTTREWYVEFAGVGERPHLTSCTLPESWERLEFDSSNGLCEYFGMGDAEDCKGCPRTVTGFLAPAVPSWPRTSSAAPRRSRG